MLKPTFFVAKQPVAFRANPDTASFVGGKRRGIKPTLHEPVVLEAGRVPNREARIVGGNPELAVIIAE